MALGDPYATRDELKKRSDIPDNDTLDDDQLAAAVLSASREIERWCRRQFNDAGVASTRTYRAIGDRLVLVDDFHTTAGLVVAADSAGAGVYNEAWVTADYLLEPLNGVVDGVPGWPYSRIKALTYGLACSERPVVQVTARWGWAAVPADVKEACLIMAAESFKLTDAPFGVAGFGEFGPVRVRINSLAEQKLAPYRRHKIPQAV
ncbi:hypothetical protein [Micromonospora sp. NPDC005324]|uniref:hypothetical protein n=1 Tax=Micromonospora sp. NPDC005324 TaxID=3157033 RepID=UPI0033AB40E6